jgi:hypothetical protein
MNAIQKVLSRRQKPESVSIEVKDLTVSADESDTRKGKIEHPSVSLTQRVFWCRISSTIWSLPGNHTVSAIEPFDGVWTQTTGGSRLIRLQVRQTIPSMTDRPVLLRHVAESCSYLKTVLDLVGGVASVSLCVMTLRLSIETYRHQVNPIASVSVKALNGLLVVNHPIAVCRPSLESLTTRQLVQDYNDFEGDMTDLGATMHGFLSFLLDMESSERIDRLKRKAVSILQMISQTSMFMEHYITKRFVGEFDHLGAILILLSMQNSFSLLSSNELG